MKGTRNVGGTGTRKKEGKGREGKEELVIISFNDLLPPTSGEFEIIRFRPSN